MQNEHQNTISIAYINEVQNSIDPGIYFRYRRFTNQFDEFDLNLINQVKLKALQDGTPEEMYNYAICLENGFANLSEDKETAVQMYKIAADKGFEPASRNYAHFQEFGEFTQQDFTAAIKRIEKYTDIEAITSVKMMKMMLSDNLDLPFPYSKKYKKLISNRSRNPNKSYSQIALLLIKYKLIIPNFKMAEKFANKAKKQFSLATAVLASITGDPRAGKPNPTKAEKMFKEVLSESKMQEIKDLYAEFLIGEGRESELEKLGIIKEEVEEQTSRPKTAAVANSQRPVTAGPAVLVKGEDLFNGYLSSKDERLLERSATAGYPVSMSCYSQYILKHKLKKQYKLAFEYLEKSAEQGIFTSFVLIGYMYDRGIFVKKDHYEALNCYMKAIENFKYKGYFGLSLTYTQGKIFEKDLFMAHRYYKKAEKKLPHCT